MWQVWFQIEDSEIPQIREKILEKRSLVFQANEQEVSKRWKFEEKVRYGTCTSSTSIV